MKPEVWCVLIVMDSNVSLLKGLTEDECRKTIQRLTPHNNPWSQAVINSRAMQMVAGPTTVSSSSANSQLIPQGSYISSVGGPAASGQITRLEFWGHLGGTLEVWPKPDDYDARLKQAMEAVALANMTNAKIDKARGL